MSIKPKSNKNIGWIPWGLRLPNLLIFIFLDAALIVCLITLSIMSSRRDGFTSIGNLNVSTWNIDWDLGLLWTTLPVLIFRLLGVYWECIASPISQRQPYVDLLKNGGAPAERSVMLDYLSIPVLWRWWTAFRNRHFLVSVCSSLTLLMSIGVTALSARLFAVQAVPTTTELPMLFNSIFDDSAINSTLAWFPVIDTVSAIYVHHGAPLPWTDQQYAFRPYQLQSFVAANAEVKVTTKAYSAYLNCSALSDYELSLRDTRLYMSASDRGCEISQDFEVSDIQEVYFKTTSETSCSADSWYSRLVFTAAMYSNDSSTLVSNVTILSCITNYRETLGDLVTSTTNDSLANLAVQSFHALESTDTRPSLWRVFEQGIMSPTTLNPQATWSTTAVGNLILYYAQQMDGTQYLSSDILYRAVSDMFSAIYLTAAAQHAFVPLETPEIIIGEVELLTQRLYTVYWVAYTIAVVLLLIMGATLAAIVHVSTHATVLNEEPAGLLAHAAILEKSPLMDSAAELRAQDNGYAAGDAARAAFKASRWGGIATTDRSGWVIARLR
ncbi:hypothetical protein C7974DRAFT_107801 [Boeremia exigua]|uniref:uncharacterized protein n=1 Tax=Boeremia exigua TaxID=749465 RepID=UPI001E8CDB4B|nr:uncharacterized protein C7974DRAFT_107801 [Boeremia exigua]KAH6642735.1 hypothetical protein C7974DRAFT_107801 [Boeremia exigua]